MERPSVLAKLRYWLEGSPHAKYGSWLTLQDEGVQWLVDEFDSLQQQLAAAQAERDRLAEWRTAVSGAIKTSPWFDTGEWGGDKEGWGYHVEMVGHLIRQVEAMRAVVEAYIARTVDLLGHPLTPADREFPMLAALDAASAGQPKTDG